MTPAGRLASVGVLFCSHCPKAVVSVCVAVQSGRKRAPVRAVRLYAGELRMTPVWTLFTLWVGLALIAGLLSVWLRVSTALTEICVGTAAQLILGTAFGAA